MFDLFSLYGSTHRSNHPRGSVVGIGPEKTSYYRNVASQYKLCSHGQLTFEPATGLGVVDGVMDIILDYSVVGRNIHGSLTNDMMIAVQNKLGIEDIATSQVDHVLFYSPQLLRQLRLLSKRHVALRKRWIGPTTVPLILHLTTRLALIQPNSRFV